MHGFSIFIKQRGFGLFFVACLIQAEESNCDLSAVVRKQKQTVLTCPKLAS